MSSQRDELLTVAQVLASWATCRCGPSTGGARPERHLALSGSRMVSCVSGGAICMRGLIVSGRAGPREVVSREVLGDPAGQG